MSKLIPRVKEPTKLIPKERKKKKKKKVKPAKLYDKPARGGLTKRQFDFVNAFLGAANGNKTKAAEMAGYAFPGVAGCKLSSNVKVQNHIRKLRDVPVMDREVAAPNEIKGFLSDVMRNDQEGAQNRLKAADMLGKFFGLHISKLQVEGSEDNPIVVKDGRGAPYKYDFDRLPLAKLIQLESLILEATIEKDSDAVKPIIASTTIASKATDNLVNKQAYHYVADDDEDDDEEDE